MTDTVRVAPFGDYTDNTTTGISATVFADNMKAIRALFPVSTGENASTDNAPPYFVRMSEEDRVMIHAELDALEAATLANQ